MTVHIASHPLVDKSVNLHGDSDVDGLDELFVFSQLPSKVSGLAALAFLINWPPVGACTLARIVCAQLTQPGGCISYIIWGIQHPGLQVSIGHLELCDQLRLIMKKFW